MQEWPQRTPLTIRHLLTYTSGLGYAFDWPKRFGMKQEEILSPTASLAEDIARLARYPLLRQPGARWHYGFSGDVLGRVARTNLAVTPVGPVAFDTGGDLRNPVVSLYEIAGGRIRFVRQAGAGRD